MWQSLALTLSAAGCDWIMFSPPQGTIRTTNTPVGCCWYQLSCMHAALDISCTRWIASRTSSESIKETARQAFGTIDPEPEGVRCNLQQIQHVYEAYSWVFWEYNEVCCFSPVAWTMPNTPGLGLPRKQSARTFRRGSFVHRRMYCSRLVFELSQTNTRLSSMLLQKLLRQQHHQQPTLRNLSISGMFTSDAKIEHEMDFPPQWCRFSNEDVVPDRCGKQGAEPEGKALY